MTEIITQQTADHIMLAVLVLGPIIGLVVGFAIKRLLPAFLTGLGIGAGNYVLWLIYNAITNALGLDTVKNLFVNLGLFIMIGALIGFIIGRYAGKRGPEHISDTSK